MWRGRKYSKNVMNSPKVTIICREWRQATIPGSTSAPVYEMIVHFFLTDYISYWGAIVNSVTNIVVLNCLTSYKKEIL